MSAAMNVQGRIVWHDLMTTNLEASRRFYGELFSWRIPSEGQWNFLYPAGDEKNHFGTMMVLEQPGVPSHWVPYVAVNDLDAAAKAITAGGGKIIVPRHSAGTTGDFVYALDPHGAAFTAWQYTGGEGKPEIDGLPPVGAFCWDELMTPDVEASKKFYGAVFGWDAETMEMGGGMQYTMWRREAKGADGKPRQAAGMMKKPPEVPRAMWLSYVTVADCDASVDKATKLGGKPTSPPMEIPNIGRFSALLDPTFAPFAILGPNKK
jgi:predicted enzyme related to lactoylglutathione lyase